MTRIRGLFLFYRSFFLIPGLVLTLVSCYLYDRNAKYDLGVVPSLFALKVIGAGMTAYLVYKRKEQYFYHNLGLTYRQLTVTSCMIFFPCSLFVKDNLITTLMDILETDSVTLSYGAKTVISGASLSGGQEAATGKGFLITDHMYDHVLDLADAFYYMEWGVTIPMSKEELLEKDYFLRMK